MKDATPEGFFMNELDQCRQCEINPHTTDSWFCSEECRAKYWGYTALGKKAPSNLTVPQIQAELLRRAQELRQSQ